MEATLAKVANRNISFAVIVATIVVAVVLDFFYTSSVDFSLRAQESALNFQSSQPLIGQQLVVRNVNIGEVVSATAGGNPIANFESGQVSVASLPDKSFTMTVEIPRNWTVSLEAKGSGLFSLHANSSGAASRNELAKLKFVAASDIALRREGGGGKDSLVPPDTEIEMTASYVDLEIGVPSARVFDQVDPTLLTLTRQYESKNGEMESEGAILNGSLWIDHAEDMPAALGPIDHLQIRKIDSGLIRAIDWNGSSFDLSASGSTGEIRNRVGRKEKELRPTILTVLRDNGLFQVMIAIITFFAGLELSAFLRKFKARDV